MKHIAPERQLKKTRIVAEAGTSHGGSLAKGRELVHAAAESGADCVKFQIVFADEILHPNTGSVPLPGGDIPLFEVFRRIEVPASFYAELRDTAATLGIDFLCTPFGITSARIIRDLELSAVKIASPELNHLPLLREIGSYGLPIIMSTGVSRLGDIEEALETIRTAAASSHSAGPEITLLHCVTAYPAPPEEYNLRLIENLRSLFGVPVGVSDHSVDPVIVPVVSVLYGAALIEKHLCLDRNDPGLDDPIALDPADFKKMVRHIRRMEEGVRTEKPPDLIDPDAIRRVSGNGIKQLAASEQNNYGRTNRSIHALTDLPPNTVITEENTAILRTEKELIPGLHPRWYQDILGAATSVSIPAGQGIRWEDLLSRP